MFNKKVIMGAAGSATTTTTGTTTGGNTTLGTVDPYFNNVSLLLTGDDLLDRSASTPVKTLTNSSTPVAVNTTTKKYGTGSLYFGGSSVLTAGDSSDLLLGTGDFTIECWCMRISRSGDDVILCNTSTASWSTNAFYFHCSHSSHPNNFSASCYNINSSVQFIYGTTNIINNVWYHVALVRSGSTFTLYVNGIAEATATSTASVDGNTAYNKYIGAAGNAANAMNGYIDDLRITKGVARYITNFTPPTAALPTAMPSADPYWYNTSLLLTGDDLLDHSPNTKSVAKSGDVISTGMIKGNGSLYFDGTGDYLTLPTNADFNFGTGDFTIEMWVNPLSVTSTTRGLFAVSGGPGSVAKFDVILVSGTPSIHYNGLTNGSNIYTASTGTITANVWTHLAFVRSSSTWTWYINGVAAGSGSNNTNLTFTTEPRYVGYGGESGFDPFNGYIDDLRITKGTARYTANFTPPASLPIVDASVDSNYANVSLLLTGSDLVDHSSSVKPLSVYGTTAISNSVKKYGTGSIYIPTPTSYIKCTDTTVGVFNTDNFTIETWVYFISNTNAQYYQCIFSTRDGTTSNANAVFFGITTTGNLVFYTTSAIVTASTVTTAGAWHHVALVRNSGVVAIYLDGQSQGSASFTTSLTGTFPSIGNEYNLLTGAMNAYFSDFRITKSVARYTANFTPPTASLPVSATLPASYDAYLANVRLLLPGDDLFDYSPASYAVTAVGDAKVRTNFKKYGTGSLYFDGTGDYLTSTSSDYAFGTGNFTVEFWYYATPSYYTNSYDQIVGTLGIDNTNGGWRIGSSYTGTRKLWFTYSNGSWNDIFSTISISDSAWNHIAVVRNSGTVTLYKNGVSIASGACSTDFTKTKLLVARTEQSGYEGETQCYIDDLRITKGIARYTSNFTPPNVALYTSPVTDDLFWNNNVLLLTGNDLADHSNTLRPLSIYGNTTVSTSVKKYGTGSIYFDGSTDYISIPGSNIELGSSDFTIEGWFNITAHQTDGGVFGKGSGTPGNDFFGVGFSGTASTVGFWVNVANSNSNIIVGTQNIVGNGWTHIAVTRSGPYTKLFVNGIQDGSTYSGSYTIGASSANPFYLMSNPYSPTTRCSTGNVSDFRITVGVARYLTNFTPPTTALPNIDSTVTVAPDTDPFWYNTSLLLTGDDMLDHSSSPKTVTINGDTNVKTGTKKYGTGSIYFDGAGDYLSVATAQALPTFDLTGDFTIECWINANNVSGRFKGICCLADSSSNAMWEFLQDNAELMFQFTGGGTSYTHGGTIIANAWMHVATVRFGSTIINYINGVSVGTSTYSGSGTSYSTSTFRVGTDRTTTNYFNGYIDDLRITKGIARYTSNFTPPAKALPVIPTTYDPYWYNNTLLLTGDDLLDHSSNVKTVTVVGDTSVNTRIKKYGTGALYFDGAGDYLTVPMEQSFQLGSSNFTIEAFIYTTDLSTYRNIIGSFISGAYSFLLDVWNGGYIHCKVNGSGELLTSSTAITAGAWHHIAVTRNGNMFTMFLNGVVVATATSSAASVTATAPIAIGANADTGYGQNWIGYIDNLRVTNGIARYVTNFTVPSAAYPTVPVTDDPFWYNTSLLLTGNDLLDHSSSPKTITKNGDAVVANICKYGTGSLYFDGTGDYLSSTSTDYALGAGNFTIEFWISFSAIGTTSKGIVGIGAENSSSRISVYAHPSAYLRVQIGSTFIDSTNTFSTNTWYHISVVRNGSSVISYVNGTVWATGTSNVNLTDTSFVGGRAYTDADNYYFNGYIDDLRITKGVARYTTTFTPPTAALPIIEPAYDPFWNNTVLLLNGDGANNSTTFTDLSPGTVVKTITANGDAKVTTSVKKFGTGSIAFDGTGDYLTIPTNSDFNFGTGNFTIEFWFNLNSLPTLGSDAQGYIAFRDQATSNYGVFIGVLPANTNKIFATSAAVDITSSVTYSVNVWNHIAYVKSGSTVTLYQNGVSVGSATHTANMTSTNSTINIGKGEWTGAPTLLNGYIDDLRITKGVARYTANFTPSSTTLPLVGPTNDPFWYNTPLLLTGDDLLDHSGVPKTVTVYGDSNATNVRKFGTGAIYFDGNGDWLSIPTVTLDITKPYTLEFWFYITNLNNVFFFAKGGGSTTVGNQWNSTDGHQLLVFISSSTLYAQYNYGSGPSPVSLTTSTIPLNSWNHVAVTYDGSSTKFFVNGSLVASSTTTPVNPTTSNKTYIGQITTTPTDNYPLAGYIDDLRITQGFARYTGNFTPSSTPAPIVEPTYDPYFNNTSLLLTGDDLLDHSYNLKDVMPHGTVSVDTSIKKYGTGSLKFDGVGDYLTVPTSSDFNFGSSNFTIECWVNISSFIGTFDPLMGIWGSAGYSWYVSVNAYNNLHKIGFSYKNGGTTSDLNFGSVNSTGVWFHLAIVRLGSLLYVYKDGNLLNSGGTSIGTIDTINQPLTIGTNDGGYFNGYIDDLRITKGVARYTTTFTPPSIALPASSGTTSLSTVATGSDSYFQNVSLLLTGDGYVDGQNNTFIDSSANNFAITRNGTPTQGAFSPYGNLWSNYFNGSTDYLSVGAASNWTFLHNGASDWTIQFSIYYTNTSQFAVLGTTAYAADIGMSVWVNHPYSGTNGLMVYFCPSGNNFISPTSLSINAWNHVAITFSTSTKVCTFYINGVSTATSPITTGYSSSNPSATMNIGRFNAGSNTPGGYVSGYISNLRISNVIQSDAQTKPTTPLTAISGTSLLTCQSNRFVDTSSNALAITVNGTPAVKRFSPFKPVTPYSVSTYGGSVYFGGSVDYLSIGSNAALEFGAGDFTVEAWVYPLAYTTYNYICCNHITNGLVFYVSASKLMLRTWNGSDLLSSTVIPALNSWSHVVVTRSSGTAKIFVNGVQTASGSVSTTFATGGGLFIGADDTTPQAPWNGYISDLRIIKGIAYPSTPTIPTAPLPETANSTAASLLCSFTNASVIDNAMCNNLTSLGDAKINTSIKKYGGGSLYFDGTGDCLTIPSVTEFNFGSGDFTVECWFNLAATQAQYSRIFQTRDGDVYAGINITVGDTTGTSIIVAFSSDGSSYLTGQFYTLTISPNIWNHIAVVRSGTSFKCYINGVVKMSIASSSALYYSATDIIVIGGQTSRVINGYIDDLRITKGVARYTDNFVPPITALPAL